MHDELMSDIGSCDTLSRAAWKGEERTECGGVVVELPERTQGMLVICKLHKGQATAAGLPPGIAPVWIPEDLDLQAKRVLVLALIWADKQLQPIYFWLQGAAS